MKRWYWTIGLILIIAFLIGVLIKGSNELSHKFDLIEASQYGEEDLCTIHRVKWISPYHMVVYYSYFENSPVKYQIVNKKEHTGEWGGVAPCYSLNFDDLDSPIAIVKNSFPIRAFKIGTTLGVTLIIIGVTFYRGLYPTYD